MLSFSEFNPGKCGLPYLTTERIHSYSGGPSWRWVLWLVLGPRWPGLASLLSSRPFNPQSQLKRSLPRGTGDIQLPSVHACWCQSLPRLAPCRWPHTAFLRPLVLLYSLSLSSANSFKAELFCLFIHASWLQIFDHCFCPSVPAGKKRHTKQPFEVQTSGSQWNSNVIKSSLDTQRGNWGPEMGNNFSGSESQSVAHPGMPL